MRKFDNQVYISDELADLLSFLEVNCSIACCGISALEIHKGLLLRKLIDMGETRYDWYSSVKEEIENKFTEVQAISVDNEADIPVRTAEFESMPAYYMPYNELLHLFKRLGIIFKQVKGSNAIP